MKSLLIFNKNTSRGFTLIETLVSIFIVTTVILGPLTVASNASAYARQTKDIITALYLAQEAVELLHHRQDSIYLDCVSQTSTTCVSQNGETDSEAAWRMFRTMLGYNSQGVSCYSIDNNSGCSYDFIDMTINETVNPNKYSSVASSCSTLSLGPDNVYVCSGVHGSGFTQTSFARSVSVTSLKTFSGADEDYNDDLRVAATVSFKRPNGYIRKIKVVDFFHAKS